MLLSDIRYTVLEHIIDTLRILGLLSLINIMLVSRDLQSVLVPAVLCNVFATNRH